ncbi:MAG: CHAT domain-containing protein [Myxococcales bacterium]|nr:CHAT domain-containing protein [Myxococcales bacterium]
MSMAIGAWLLWGTVAHAWSRADLEHMDEALTRAHTASVEDGGLPTVEAALQRFGDAFVLAEAQADPVAVAAVWHEVGSWFRHQGFSQQALHAFERSLVGLEQGVTQRDEALQRDIAVAVLDLGAKGFVQAKAVAPDLYWVSVDAMAPWLDHRDGRGRLTVALQVAIGNLYLEQQQLEQAGQLYDAALAGAEALGDDALRAGVRVDLAWLALRSDRPAEAIARVREMEKLGLLVGDSHVALRGAWLARGVAAGQAGRPRRASRLLGEAVELYRRADDRRGLGTALVHRGRAQRQLGRPEAAMASLSAAVDLRITGGDVAWSAHLERAQLLAEQGRRTEALADYDAYVRFLATSSEGFGTDQGRFSILESHDANLDAMVELAVDVALATGDAGLARRVAAVARRRSFRALSSAPRGAVRVGELPVEYVVPDIGMDTPVQMALATELGPGWDAHGVTADLGEVTDEGAFALPADPEGHTLLEIYLLQRRTLVSVVQPDGTVHVATSEVGRAQVAEWVSALRARVGVSDPASTVLSGSAWPRGRGLDVDEEAVDEEVLGRPARRLYDALVAPVEAWLPGADESLVIVPHGVLWHAPFAALRTTEHTWFGDRVFSLGVSAASVGQTTASPRPARDRALVVGNPGAGEVWACDREIRFGGLEGAQAEARAIAKRDWSHSDLLLGDEVDALRLDAWHGSYGVLHFATHGGVCPEDSLGSFVLLGDPAPAVWSVQPGPSKQDWMLVRTDDDRLPIRVGASLGLEQPVAPTTLTARHVLDRWRLQADLVALSACDTGLGPASSEGTIGLMRAFAARGARSVLVSLWKVDDVATARWMEAFYDGYLEHGHKAVAARDAMKAVRAEWPEPRFWAPFMLVGAPD